MSSQKVDSSLSRILDSGSQRYVVVKDRKDSFWQDEGRAILLGFLMAYPRAAIAGG